MSNYPSHIAEGYTWLKILNGILTKEKVKKAIKDFYKLEYQKNA